MTKAVDDRNVVKPVAKYNCEPHSIYLFPILCFFRSPLLSTVTSLTFQYIYVRISHILTSTPPLLHYLLNKPTAFLSFQHSSTKCWFFLWLWGIKFVTVKKDILLANLLKPSPHTVTFYFTMYVVQFSLVWHGCWVRVTHGKERKYVRGLWQ